MPPPFIGPLSSFFLPPSLCSYLLLHRSSCLFLIRDVLKIPSPLRGLRRTVTSLRLPLLLAALSSLLSFHLFLYSPPAPPSLATASFQAAIRFHSFCNLILPLFFCVTQWESFPASLPASISTLSFAKRDLFCSSSLRHNHAVFIEWKRGSQGDTGKEEVRGENEKKRTKQTSAAED